MTLDDPTTRLLPSNLERRSSPHAGFGVYASSRIQRGTRILCTHSLGSIFTDSHLCTFCGCSYRLVITCSICRIRHFCSADCLRRSRHEICCSIRAQLSGIDDDDFWRDMSLLFQIELSEQRDIDLLECFKLLPTHEAESSFSGLIPMLEKVSASSNLSPALKVTTPVALQHWFSSLCRFRVNNPCIYDDQLFAVGEGCFPAVSLLNHSCWPNVVVIFECQRHGPPKAYWIAVEDIECNQELTIAYVDALLPAKQRRALLRMRYFFECLCKQCTITTAVHTKSFLDEKLSSTKIEAILNTVNLEQCQQLFTKIQQEKTTAPFVHVEQFLFQNIHRSPADGVKWTLHGLKLLRQQEPLLELSCRTWIPQLNRWSEKLLTNGKYREAADVHALICVFYYAVYPSCHPIIILEWLTVIRLRAATLFQQQGSADVENGISSLLKQMQVGRQLACMIYSPCSPIIEAFDKTKEELQGC